MTVLVTVKMISEWNMYGNYSYQMLKNICENRRSGAKKNSRCIQASVFEVFQ